MWSARYTDHAWVGYDGRDLTYDFALSGALGAMQPRTPFEVNRGEPQDNTEQEDTSASGM